MHYAKPPLVASNRIAPLNMETNKLESVINSERFTVAILMLGVTTSIRTYGRLTMANS